VIPTNWIFNTTHTIHFPFVESIKMEEELQQQQQPDQPQEVPQEEKTTSRIVTDGISDLQNLTRMLISRMSDMIEHVLLKSSEVKEDGSAENFPLEEEVCFLPPPF